MMKVVILVMWVLACVQATGTTAELEKPKLSHTAVRCSVDEAGEPEIQVRRCDGGYAKGAMRSDM